MARATLSRYLALRGALGHQLLPPPPRALVLCVLYALCGSSLWSSSCSLCSLWYSLWLVAALRGCSTCSWWPLWSSSCSLCPLWYCLRVLRVLRALCGTLSGLLQPFVVVLRVLGGLCGLLRVLRALCGTLFVFFVPFVVRLISAPARPLPNTFVGCVRRFAVSSRWRTGRCGRRRTGRSGVRLARGGVRRVPGRGHFL